jgi:hypothetical protein
MPAAPSMLFLSYQLTRMIISTILASMDNLLSEGIGRKHLDKVGEPSVCG